MLAPVMTVSRFSSRERKTRPEVTGTGYEVQVASPVAGSAEGVSQTLWRP
jgi:hypothetical protein